MYHHVRGNIRFIVKKHLYVETGAQLSVMEKETGDEYSIPKMNISSAYNATNFSVAERDLKRC